jgi:microcystin-dependent protein
MPIYVRNAGAWNAVSGAPAAPVLVPAGTVITIASSTAPTGYIKANGASLSTTTYADLFAAIGYTFGGSGATFGVPDLRGEFIRGWADDRAVDTGRVFGSTQTDAFKSHTHTYVNNGSGLDNPYNFNGGANRFNQYGNAEITGATGGTETRPRNIALLYCIKY